ncbi:MAG TPA: NAD(P)/FAD-dependent oxidoreductase [Terriglobales bacterium]
MASGKHLDIAIIGAGIAGLRAAAALATAGLKVVILEARGRIGGRIYTCHDPLSGLPVELGAEFIHGKHPELLSLIENASLSLTEVTGEHRFLFNGKLEQAGDRMQQVQGLLQKMPGTAARDRSFADFLRECDCDAETKGWAASYVEGFNAADQERISAYALQRQSKAEEEIDGDKSFRLINGYEGLPLALFRSVAQRIELHRNTVVKRVEWRRNHVELSTRVLASGHSRTFEAKKCLITVPLGVLQAAPSTGAGIVFAPEITQIRNAARQLAMGPVLKIVLRFRERFWESRKELDSISFLHSQNEWFPTWWTTFPIHAPLLTGWMGGAKAQKAAATKKSEILDQAIASLSPLLHLGEKELFELLDNWYFHDWQSDPFSLGAYSYVPAGAWEAAQQLSAPAENTLFVAGEAADFSGHWGTVHGALLSGSRAAHAVLESW